MKERYINDIIRIINIFSFIFAVLNSIFSMNGLEQTNNYLFVWTTTNLIFFYWITKNRTVGRYVAPIFLLLPIVFIRGGQEVLFLFLTVLIAVFLLQGRIENYRYSTVSEEFRKSFLVIGSIYGFSLLVEAKSLFNSYVAPYVFIYLISSILLLRTLRYIENKGDVNKINKINLRSTIGIIIFSFGFSNQSVLELMKKALLMVKVVYDKIILTLISLIIIPLGFIINTFLEFFMGFFGQQQKEPEPVEMNGELDPTLSYETMSPEAMEKLNQLLMNIFLVLIIIGFLYIIFRIYVKQGKKEIVSEEYVESKEFIFNERKKEMSFLQRLTNFIKPKTNEDKIRLHYKKFLETCKACHIEILGSDTSEDVNAKAQYTFDPTIMEKMRGIYIRVRYGQQKVDNPTYNEFMGYYKELNKIAKNRSN